MSSGVSGGLQADLQADLQGDLQADQQGDSSLQRSPGAPVPRSALQALQAEPHRSSFVQAVRLLELHFTRRGMDANEIFTRRLRFGQSLSLAFPASEIASLSAQAEPPESAGTEPAVEAAPFAQAHLAQAHLAQAHLVPAFMGFLGAGGTLPSFYTELLAERETLHRDRSARAFLDIFQQRAVSMFYAAWRKHRLPVRFERDRHNEYLPLLLALAGLGQRPLQQRLAPRQGGVADDTLAFFAGHLQRRTPSAASLRQMLSEYFQVPVLVESFVGRWFELPRAQHALLGVSAVQLGGGAVAGERVWQRDLRLRLHIGPLRRTQFQRFLPGGPAQRALRELLQLLTGGTLEFEVRLTLHADDVAPAALHPAQGPRLGWDGFLVTRTVQDHRSDAGYDLAALA